MATRPAPAPSLPLKPHLANFPWIASPPARQAPSWTGSFDSLYADAFGINPIVMKIERRDFLKTAAGATVGTGLVLGSPGAAFGDQPAPRTSPLKRRSGQAPDFVVIGAGSFGMWTALNLIRLGATVTVVDPFGAANSRSTSGGETRGVRSSYGDRPHGMHWTTWATESIKRWKAWDEQNRELLLPPVFFQTGDLIMRPEMEPYLEDTAAQWDQIGVEYESLGVDEIRHRWPWINPDGITTALYEPQAGVVRARRAIESVAMPVLAGSGEAGDLCTKDDPDVAKRNLAE